MENKKQKQRYSVQKSNRKQELVYICKIDSYKRHTRKAQLFTVISVQMSDNTHDIEQKYSRFLLNKIEEKLVIETSVFKYFIHIKQKRATDMNDA